LSNSENEYFSNGNTTSFLNEQSEFNNKRSGFLSTIGANFYILTNTTLTAQINYTNLNYNSKSNTQSIFFSASKIPTTTNNRKYLSGFDDTIFEFEVDLEHNFKKEGRTLSSYFIYVNDEENQKFDINNSNINFTNQSYLF
jgi:hypothetical protein